jgi:hypothetical protein
MTEREVELDAVVGVVPGTLTVPGATVGAVLLSGGGPFDRDETSGPNKPLRDLAAGLAERGIATLRFDKLSHLGAPPTLTMTAEYVPHAVAAVRALRAAASGSLSSGTAWAGRSRRGSRRPSRAWPGWC